MILEGKETKNKGGYRMTLTKILEKIENRIIELENKKERLDLKEISAAKRTELKERYEQELDKLHIMKKYSR